MKATDYEQMLGDIKAALAANASTTFAIIGHTPLAYDLISFFRSVGAEARLLGVYAETGRAGSASVKLFSDLVRDNPTVAIVASDANKESLLEGAAQYLTPATRVLLAGYGHFEFKDDLFENSARSVLVPSLANGYPNSLIHIYQCLKNAARLDLEGVVVEFGMFKGGTTTVIANFVKNLGRTWRVIGFDTFAGFPPKRSPLDMYDHPDCVFPDEEAVRNYVRPLNIEVVSGDVVKTVTRLSSEQIVLAFVDTDNYTSACAILDVIQDRIVPHGAIVFDHFTGRDRFRYTLGERLAAKRLLQDRRYFNLHHTGVFFRQS
jgi:hypothetical protein